MYRSFTSFLIVMVALLAACRTTEKIVQPGSYLYDRNFMTQQNLPFIELTEPNGQARVLTSAEYQGRVMTSTASGEDGTSYGWLNYGLLSAPKKSTQFNPVGGEERFWIGPEGGQFSFYFHSPDSFVFKNWKVPALIDTEPFEVTSRSETEVVFAKRASLTNYQGTPFELSIARKISLLNREKLAEALSTPLQENVKAVGYVTENTITNEGEAGWTQESGLLSVWLLGMFTPSPSTVVFIPFHPRIHAKEQIATNYFGEIPSDRLSITDSLVYFKCDGKYRSKIGLPPAIAKPMAASYDFSKNILTLIRFEVQPAQPYVNSKWEHQANPYHGDAVNSYNDGPLEDGTQMGPFYELESSSPAWALTPGEQKTYTQLTAHLEGDLDTMALLVKSIFGVDLTTIRN